MCCIYDDPSELDKSAICLDDGEEDIDISTCPGCGSYGVFDSACIRMIDGQLEECGIRG